VFLVRNARDPEPPAKTEVQVTALTHMQNRAVVEPLPEVGHTRRHTARILSELEQDLTRLYLRLMDEPVPARLIDVLRARLTSNKS